VDLAIECCAPFSVRTPTVNISGDSEYRELSPNELNHVKTVSLTSGGLQVREMEDSVLLELLRKGLVYVEVGVCVGMLCKSRCVLGWCVCACVCVYAVRESLCDGLVCVCACVYVRVCTSWRCMGDWELYCMFVRVCFCVFLCV
jgi:hypothetical protein